MLCGEEIFVSPRFLLHGSERCRRRVRTTGIAGLVSTWMTGTICGSSPGTVIKKRAALRAAEADHNAYGHMGFPGWRVSMKNHSISSSSQKENSPTIKKMQTISAICLPRIIHAISGKWSPSSRLERNRGSRSADSNAFRISASVRA